MGNKSNSERTRAYDGFVYIWMNTRSKKFYIGSHKGTIDDGYTGSGTLFTIKYNNEPHNFKRRILQYVVGDLDYIREIEERWLSLIKDEELHGVKYYNRTKTVALGAYGSLNTKWITNGPELKKLFPDQELPDGWRYGQSDAKIEQLRAFRHTEESKQAIREFRTGIPHSPERIQKQKDTKMVNENRWYTNGVEEKQFSKFETVPDGWYPGRFERTWETVSGSKGRVKITDGVHEKYVMPGECIPDGWHIGRAESVRKSMRNNKGQTGRIVINNGIDEKFMDKGTDVPDGWFVGRISSSVRGKMIINNGIEQTYIFRGTAIPEGWTKGRAPKDRK